MGGPQTPPPAPAGLPPLPAGESMKSPATRERRSHNDIGAIRVNVNQGLVAKRQSLLGGQV